MRYTSARKGIECTQGENGNDFCKLFNNFFLLFNLVKNEKLHKKRTLSIKK